MEALQKQMTKRVDVVSDIAFSVLLTAIPSTQRYVYNDVGQLTPELFIVYTALAHVHTMQLVW